MTVFSRLIKPAEPDPILEPFRDGVGALSRNGVVVGYVATSVAEFWSPCLPWQRQWCVWIIVVWADGTRDRSTEDYPPWSYVNEMAEGHFDWAGPGFQEARYDFAWLPPSEAIRQRARLGILESDL